MLGETVRELQNLAARYNAVAVSYSDGKDSRVVMDLCVRLFDRVEAYFMFLVPGLQCIEEPLAEAEKRWGVAIRRYPHWITAKFIKGGVYCHPKWAYDKLPDYKLRHVYALALKDCNVKIVATGAKKSDSSWRRRFMANTAKWAEVVNPIAEWNIYDVRSYLKMRNIPEPDTHKGNATGIDLSPQALLWLHDTHPTDFKRLCEFFTFAEAIVWRRKFYSV